MTEGNWKTDQKKGRKGYGQKKEILSDKAQSGEQRI